MKKWMNKQRMTMSKLALGLLVLGGVVAQAENAHANGPYCREYTQMFEVAGSLQQGYGTACMQPDGSWQIISEAKMPSVIPTAPVVATAQVVNTHTTTHHVITPPVTTHRSTVYVQPDPTAQLINFGLALWKLSDHHDHRRYKHRYHHGYKHYSKYQHKKHHYKHRGHHKGHHKCHRDHW